MIARGSRHPNGTGTAGPCVRVVDTPLGAMRLQAEGGALTGAWFLDQRDCPAMPEPAAEASPSPDAGGRDSRSAEDAVLDQAVRELAEYFAGRLRAFSLPMAPQGTPFQRRVWDALRDLDFGVLESYGALAQRCATPAAVRAVAQAVGRNPISIFIPCHRVVGADSALTGFGGGLHRKQALLALEGHAYASPARQARRAQQDPRQGSLWDSP